MATINIIPPEQKLLVISESSQDDKIPTIATILKISDNYTNKISINYIEKGIPGSQGPIGPAGPAGPAGNSIIGIDNYADLPSATSITSDDLLVMIDSGNPYVTKKISWGNIDAPQNGVTYAKKNGGWVDIYNTANLQLSMGTYSEVNSYIPLPGEPIYDATNKVVYIGDGSTVRGNLISNTSKFTKLANSVVFEQQQTTLGSCTITFIFTGSNVALFTKSNHGLKQRDRVKFSTTGSLPIGLSASTTYYVLSTELTLNTFRLSESPYGSPIIISGSQSGTHTLTKISTNNSIPLTVSLNSLNSIWEITTLAHVQSSGPGNILYINLYPSINNISIESFDLIKKDNNSTQLSLDSGYTIEFTDSDICYLKYHHIVQLTGSEATFGIPFEELSGVEAYLISMSILAKRIS